MVKTSDLIPSGILFTDRWHRGTNDGHCSRCERAVPDSEVPLMVWSADGNDMLIYCQRCTGLSE